MKKQILNISLSVAIVLTAFIALSLTGTSVVADPLPPQYECPPAPAQVFTIAYAISWEQRKADHNGDGYICESRTRDLIIDNPIPIRIIKEIAD
jgi:hypothetical protein